MHNCPNCFEISITIIKNTHGRISYRDGDAANEYLKTNILQFNQNIKLYFFNYRSLQPDDRILFILQNLRFNNNSEQHTHTKMSILDRRRRYQCILKKIYWLIFCSFFVII